jgi:hypothetical protein
MNIPTNKVEMIPSKLRMQRKKWDQLDTRLVRYVQNCEWTSGWKSQFDIVRLGVSGAQNWRPDLIRVTSDIVRWGRTLSGRWSLENVIFSQNLPLSSQVWFLSYIAPNWMKIGHKGHLNTRNKFPKVIFSKSNDFPSDFGWTQKPRFWENEEKFMKSKGLEAWIHSKVGGRRWGSS